MNLQKSLIFSLSLSAILASCSTGEKKVAEQKVVVEETVEIKAPHQGFATIPALTESFISSVKDNKYDDYVSHVMTREEEHKQSKRIKDDNIRHEFLNEFDFNLSHEEEEFNNMINYLSENNIDLNKLQHEEAIVLDYKDNKFSPVEVKEVIVPVIHDDIEADLIYMVIRINDRWFLTSELGL